STVISRSPARWPPSSSMTKTGYPAAPSGCWVWAPHPGAPQRPRSQSPAGRSTSWRQRTSARPRWQGSTTYRPTCKGRRRTAPRWAPLWPRAPGHKPSRKQSRGQAMHEQPVQLSVNRTPIVASVEPRMTLADFLRHERGLTGTHLGCEHGACGACTVLLDGDAVRSCLMFAVQADAMEVTTVEGIASPDGTLSPVQAALRECPRLQSRFST